jgi:hypothetical protein
LASVEAERSLWTSHNSVSRYVIRLYNYLELKVVADLPKLVSKIYRVRARADRIARRSPTSIYASYTPTSTRDNLSTMTPIEEALAAIESREPGDDLVYQEYADWFGVSRVTLARRHQGRQQSRTAQFFDQRKLTPQQEEELVLYIRDLTERGLSPTNTIIRNFASTIAHERVSKSWVTRFKHRHEDTLISKWGRAIDSTRHKANSYFKYKLYFKLMHGKIDKHKIQPQNSYNIDEKGIIIGVIGNSKRVFTRAQ